MTNSPSISIRLGESDTDISRCFDVLSKLRPHLVCHEKLGMRFTRWHHVLALT
jgi:hypothetical protein